MQKQSEVYSVFKFHEFLKFYGLEAGEFAEEERLIVFPEFVPQEATDFANDIVELEEIIRECREYSEQ